MSKSPSLPLLLELGIVSRTAIDECFPIRLLQDDFGVQVHVSIIKEDNENNIIGFSMKVFQSWFGGSRRQPATCKTLIDVLMN